MGLLESHGWIAWLLLRHHAGPAGVTDPSWRLALLVLLMLFPASEAVVAVINRLISESVPPDRLPRLALAQGLWHPVPPHRCRPRSARRGFQ